MIFLFPIMAFGLSCPKNPKNAILFIDACPTSLADVNIGLRNGTCNESSQHARKVIELYRNLGGTKVVYLASYTYREVEGKEYILIKKAYKFALRCKFGAVNFSGGGYTKVRQEIQFVGLFNGKFYAAAGNDRRNLNIKPFYPAAIPGVIAIGATPCKTKRKYSNYGTMVRRYYSGCNWDNTDEGTSYAVVRALVEDELNGKN